MADPSFSDPLHVVMTGEGTSETPPCIFLEEKFLSEESCLAPSLAIWRSWVMSPSSVTSTCATVGKRLVLSEHQFPRL